MADLTAKGVHDYRKAVERAEREEADGAGPTYADGTLYAMGDVLPEGPVRYARRVGAEDPDPERWRLVVIDPTGGPSRTIRPSTTRPLSRGGRTP